MASLNRVTLIGNVGQDPEVRTIPSGEAVANISIATTDKWTDKASGAKKEHTEWHRLVFFDRLAEIVGEYVRKGSSIYVEGSLRTRKYEKDGSERSSTEIRVLSMQMLGAKRDDAAGGARSAAPAPAGKPSSGFDDMDDDIPF